MTASSPISPRAAHARTHPLRLALVAAMLASVASLVTTRITRAQTPTPAPRPAAAADSVPGWRFRLLGAFDESSGEPIEGVKVEDVLSGLSMTTTATGTVTLVFLPPGGSLVRLRKLGYETQTFFVAIAPADTAPVTTIMRRVTTLATVHVTDSASGSAALRDAEERMRAARGGYFIDEARMRKLDNSTLTQALISRLPGMMVSLGPHGEEYLVSTRRPCAGTALGGCQQRCYISVFVDGVPYTAVNGVVDFSRWSTQQFASVEFYPDQEAVPLQFRSGDSPCGVLLLWTRAR